MYQEFQLMCERLNSHIDCLSVLDNLNAMGANIVIEKRNSRQPQLLCLNHDDHNTDSCKILPDGSHVKCHACGWSATPIKLVQKAIDTGRIHIASCTNSFRAACEIIASWTGDETIWDKKAEKREYIEPFRLNKADLDILGVNDTQTLKKLYDQSREEFWRYLEACVDLVSEKIAIALEIEDNPDVRDCLEALSAQVEAFCIELKEGKKKNKEKTPLFIK